MISHQSLLLSTAVLNGTNVCIYIRIHVYILKNPGIKFSKCHALSVFTKVESLHDQ